MDKPGRLCSGILWAVLLFMAVLSVMAVRNPGRTEVLSFSAPENFSAGWVVENGGEPMPVASIVVKPGDVISISKQIPPELSGQVFCFRNRHFDVRFSIDGKVISRVGTDAPLTFLGGMASSWECFTFAPSYAGKKLNVRVENRGKAQTLEITPRCVIDDLLSLKFAAMAGTGMGWLPDYMVAPELRDGRLVRLLTEWSQPRAIVHAVFASRRGMSPAVRSFLDFLGEVMPSHMGGSCETQPKIGGM